MNQLEIALGYAHRGWRVIPIRPGEKHPPIPRWQEAATTLEETIVTWWTGPYANHGIGIATGPASGIFVLDIDDKEGNRGYDTLNDLETAHSPLPETLTVITGSGGNHLYFTYPANQTIRNDHGRRLGSGLDIRGEGGQVVAPGSTHPNGTTYEFDADTEHLEPQPAPQWLLTLLQDPEPPTPPQEEHQPPFTKEELEDAIASAEIMAEVGDEDGIKDLQDLRSLYNRYYS